MRFDLVLDAEGSVVVLISSDSEFHNLGSTSLKVLSSWPTVVSWQFLWNKAVTGRPGCILSHQLPRDVW